jgi:LPXTG-site transpeptidase (sortase) family protein
MSGRFARLSLIGILVGLLALAGAVATIGYVGQAQVQIKLSGPSGAVKCNRSATISAKVVSAKTGRPVPNQNVTWSLSQSQSSGDRLSASRTTTNRKGVTGVTLSFGPVAGARTVTATVTVSSPSVTVRCAGGLPRTATLPPAGFEEPASSALLAPPTIPEVAAEGGRLPAVGLRMDRLGIDLPIVEGDGVTVPEGAAAHYPGTAWPGEGSNTYVYAHAREGHFLELWQVRTGDLVEMDMADGSVAEYRVSQVLPLVEWDALERLAPTPEEILTLQTCLSYEETAPRFVVIAQRVAAA